MYAMLPGLFITGTDTNVGKTVTAAALMHRYRRVCHMRYWKPIQTGIEQDDDTATVRRLAACGDSDLWTEGIRLHRPLSPHLAAEWSGARIDISQLDRFIAAMPVNDRWLIEGAGGVLVPINECELMIDFMVHLAMPVLVVARSTLGTINHTLLTIETLHRRGLEVAGVVMVGERNRGNRETIERFGAVRVLGEMPIFAQLTPEALGNWAKMELDPEGHFARYLAER